MKSSVPTDELRLDSSIVRRCPCPVLSSSPDPWPVASWRPASAFAAAADTLRPPAVPLVTHDPYFSIWSAADRLTDDWPKHWTGRTQAMSGLRPDRRQALPDHGPVPPARARPDPGLAARSSRPGPSTPSATPAIELTADVPVAASGRGSRHPVAAGELSDLRRSGRRTAVRTTCRLYFDASSEIAVNDAGQSVVWSRLRLDGLEALAIGTRDQPVLARKGDDLRIDWGYFYLGVPDGQGARTLPGPGPDGPGRVPGRRAPAGPGRHGHAAPVRRRISGGRRRLRSGPRRRRAGLPPAHPGLRRSVLDRVLLPQAAAVLAARRLGGRRTCWRPRAATMPGSDRALPAASTPSSWPT